ncbi:MAG: hypothetical protein RL352_276 [Actinomycetota bacterium]|jgi:hypothetical protein
MAVDPSAHRSLAIEANNSTWEILGKPADQILPDEAEEMTRRAYAAAYHWQRAEGSTPANSARADWLLSRVWAVRGQGDQAMLYAKRCMATCETSSLVDFDLAYAHEALARAHACLGQASEARRHKERASQISIADPEDKAVVDGDLASEPWFVIS